MADDRRSFLATRIRESYTAGGPQLEVIAVMDLQTFITQTLVQIARGIEGAMDELKHSTAKVSPSGVVPSQSSESKFHGYIDEKTPEKWRKIVHEIEFDVAIHVSEGTKTKGGIGIVVAGIGLGSSGESQAGTGSQSRIKFKIPMVLPTDK